MGLIDLPYMTALRSRNPKAASSSLAGDSISFCHFVRQRHIKLPHKYIYPPVWLLQSGKASILLEACEAVCQQTPATASLNPCFYNPSCISKLLAGKPHLPYLPATEFLRSQVCSRSRRPTTHVHAPQHQAQISRCTVKHTRGSGEADQVQLARSLA